MPDARQARPGPSNPQTALRLAPESFRNIEFGLLHCPAKRANQFQRPENRNRWMRFSKPELNNGRLPSPSTKNMVVGSNCSKRGLSRWTRPEIGCGRKKKKGTLGLLNLGGETRFGNTISPSITVISRTSLIRLRSHHGRQRRIEAKKDVRLLRTELSGASK